MKRRDFLHGVGSLAGGLAVGEAIGHSSAKAHGQATGLQAAVPSLPERTDPRFWQVVREQFQLPADFAYLNTGGLGASPRAVTNTLTAWTDREEANPAPGHSEDDWTRIRTRCASLLGPSCSGDEIALVSTATEGLNAILNTIPLTPGDEVITSTHEHPSLIIPLLHKMRTHKIVVRTFEPDMARARGNVDAIEAQVTPRTRLIFISHVTCTTGQIMPVAEIGRLAAARGIAFALDGAQSLAHLPFDIAKTGAHYYAASCHKWLLGPKRTGVLYVRRDRFATAVPTVVGAYSDAVSSLPDRRLDLRPNAQRFEYGTQNDALVYGVEAAIDFLFALGITAIWERNRALAERFVDGITRMSRVSLLSPGERSARSAMVTFKIAGRDNRQIAAELVRRRLRVRSVTEAGLDAVRVSFHVYNAEPEVDRLLAALGEIAAAGGAKGHV
jgi:selenocysteine lyase/cysteine desulfurase